MTLTLPVDVESRSPIHTYGGQATLKPEDHTVKGLARRGDERQKYPVETKLRCVARTSRARLMGACA